MKTPTKTLRRAALPLTVFLAVLCLHFLWYTRWGPHVGWVSLGPTASPSPLLPYLESQSVWLGASYALSLAFAAAALRRYREERFCQTCYLTIGGISVSGILAIGGCYILGCCGSPMVAVYLSLFGTTFLPLAEPLAFLLTSLFLAAMWWWMNHAKSPQASAVHTVICPQENGCSSSTD